MPRYFFHVRSQGGLIRDEEGAVLPDLAAVREETRQAAKEMLKAAIDRDDLLDGQRFEVENEAGESVLIYRFKEAISLD